jgi:Phosphoglycerate mutase 1
LFEISNEDISKLEIPTGNPLIIKFDENNKLISAKYLDKERAKDLIKFN